MKGFAGPLNALTKKGVKFEWTEACSDAFDKLKRALVSAPILAYPNFKEELLLFVDASSTGIGFTPAESRMNEWQRSSCCLQRSWFKSS